jgi:hypothetical protein
MAGEEELLRYSADLPIAGSSAPPGNAPIVRVRDVAVLTGDPTIDQGDHGELALLPQRRGYELVDPEPIDLGRGLTLAQLDHDEAERVLNACSPRGHFFVPVKQYGQMYSLVREVDLTELEPRRWGWDPGGLINDALAMSRLILDNGYSTDYAARIFDHANGEQQVMPPTWVSRPIWRVRRSRDWFTSQEAIEFRDLLGTYWEVRDALPERVAHAQRQAEDLASVSWLHAIGPLLVIAFESLIGTSTTR